MHGIFSQLYFKFHFIVGLAIICIHNRDRFSINCNSNGTNQIAWIVFLLLCKIKLCGCSFMKFTCNNGQVLLLLLLSSFVCFSKRTFQQISGYIIPNCSIENERNWQMLSSFSNINHQILEFRNTMIQLFCLDSQIQFGIVKLIIYDKWGRISVMQIMHYAF